MFFWDIPLLIDDADLVQKLFVLECRLVVFGPYHTLVTVHRLPICSESPCQPQDRQRPDAVKARWLKGAAPHHSEIHLLYL